MKDVDLERNVTGAGMILTFADGGIAHVPFDLLNWGSTGASSVLAQYNTQDGFIVPESGSDRRFTLSASFAEYLTNLLTNSNRSSDEGITISFTGGIVGVPTSPEEIECPAGNMNVNDYRCSNCTAGTYTPDPGYRSCLECPVGTYKSDDYSSSCIECPSGTTTWHKGSSSISECMCKENYYDKARVQPHWTYTGCFQDCGNQTSGTFPCPSNENVSVTHDLPVKGVFCTSLAFSCLSHINACLSYCCLLPLLLPASHVDHL